MITEKETLYHQIYDALSDCFDLLYVNDSYKVAGTQDLYDAFGEKLDEILNSKQTI